MKKDKDLRARVPPGCMYILRKLNVTERGASNEKELESKWSRYPEGGAGPVGVGGGGGSTGSFLSMQH